jgi:protease-4
MSEVLAMTEAALADEGVQAVRYAFDSPGGTATGVPEAATSLFQARQQTDKPMIGTVEGFCCSGAWWLGSQLDALYVSEGSRIGSMGVIAQAVDPTRMQKNAGLDTRTFASNSVKAGEGPDWERDIQAQVDRYHALFVSAVARGRGISIEAAMKMAGSRVFIGADAVAAGFADAVATGDEVMGQYGVKTAEKR